MVSVRLLIVVREWFLDIDGDMFEALKYVWDEKVLFLGDMSPSWLSSSIAG